MKCPQHSGSSLVFALALSLYMLSAKPPDGSLGPSAASSTTTSTAASADARAATLNTSSSDWRARALAACTRHGCDGLLLIAIALVETQGQPDPDDTWHADKVSWGRYGMQVLTGARWVYGRWRSRLSGHEAIAVEQALMDPERGPDLAAQQLAWCQRRARRIAGAARCWNPRDSAYPAKVMAEYRRLKKEATGNQRIALIGR